MGIDPSRTSESKKCVGQAVGAIHHELDKQSLRILRCTAQAMASSPGGLRFQAGTRPWLEGLANERKTSSLINGRRLSVDAQPIAD